MASSGQLSKLRLPINLSPAIGGQPTGPLSFWDFQQAVGTRQVLSHFGSSLYYFTNDLANSTLIETNALNTAPWSFVEANNIMFGANGSRMQKWTGTKWQQWGITAPTVAPFLGGANNGTTGAPLLTGVVDVGIGMTRAANVVTGTLPSAQTAIFLSVGDTITIFNCTDASFNGNFKIASVVTPGLVYTWAQTAAAQAVSQTANATVPFSNWGPFNISSLVRTNGNTVLTTTVGFGIAPPSFITIAGSGDASFNGTFAVVSFNTGTGVINFAQPNLADLTVGAGGTVTGGITSVGGGWKWAYAWMNSVTGAISNISPTTAATGNQTSRMFWLAIPAPPTDPQVDTIVWFRTLDGGGDYFQLLSTTSLGYAFGGGPNYFFGVGGFIDGVPDSALDLTKRGPLINNPPPQGTYVALAQGRIFVAGLVGAGSVVAYSGYEQIVLGRPEESFPPFNRINIVNGAESVVGIGVTHAGPVFFSNTGKMWQLRGAIEDITLSAPVAFSDVLEELPWTMGCLSHYTIQSMPYGLVWLAGDKTLQFWDGRSNPIDISASVYPILRSITPGTELQANGSYFNWLERDWYALTCATNGSLTNNTIIFWALDAQSSNIEIFVSNLSTQWLGVVSTSKLQRKLLMSNGGRIAELPVRAVDQNGLVNDFVTYPPTAGQLAAYWRSGYFGNESPEQSKMYRWTRIVPDRAAPAYQVQSRFVDDTFTIDTPNVVGPVPASQQRTPLNVRGYRCSIEIDFPLTDTSFNVLELQLAYIGTSQR